MPKRNAVVGKLIIFEGPDGVGKSTISREVFRRLEQDGVKCQLLTFPGKEDGTLGQLVYQIHHEPQKFGLKCPTSASMQALHVAAHLDAIERRIAPALREGTTILLDRYWWSTWVYGLVGGVEPGVVTSMVDLECKQWGDVVPALAVLIRRETPINRDEEIDYWHRLRDEYDKLVQREQQKHPVIINDNVGTLESSVEEILGAIHEIGVYAPNPQPIQGELEIEQGQTPPTDSLAPNVISHISPILPTVVYDTFWRFAAERQKIFFQRLDDEPPPWTEDPILTGYRFTNAYRASDRTSQYLIRNVIYRDDLPHSAREVFFRIVVFKIFNLIDTWELLEESLGQVTFENYSFKQFDQILSNAIASKRRIYSGAYIMPPGTGSFGYRKKHRNHLALIEKMMGDNLPERLTEAKNMQSGFEQLREYPTIGDFLAYQLITDINYSEMINFTEMEFVVPGPGARDGIQKCFVDRGGLNEPEIIKFIAERQEHEFERLGLKFQTLWGRHLQLIDCQNLFCEVDKYARVRHPEVDGRSGRTRIKRKYSQNSDHLPLWYPPKWGLNRNVGTAPKMLGAS